MIVYDLFSGTGSATKAFADAGHSVISFELNPSFEATYTADVRDIRWDQVVEEHGLPDFLWASPPCTSFSVGSFRHHWRATSTCKWCNRVLVRVSGEAWEHDPETVMCNRPSSDGSMFYEPKSDTGKLGRDLLLATLHAVNVLSPRWWVMENPRALMRKMPVLRATERRTITHCQYGDPRRMKPTDLWGVFPVGFEARACKNGDPCHEAAPRGARTGTQGLSSKDAAMLPPMLGEELLAAIVSET